MTDDATVYTCKGPPVCLLEDDDAVAAMQAGCPWCKQTIMHPDGSETVLDVTVQ